MIRQYFDIEKERLKRGKGLRNESIDTVTVTESSFFIDSHSSSMVRVCLSAYPPQRQTPKEHKELGR